MDQSRRWLTLAIVGAAFFMTVLDVAIVNVALPSIEKDLKVTETTVQWVLIAYATTFEEGAERNKALGIWGALGGSGAAAGVLFGGILTKYLGWQWIFYVNVPVGALVLALTRPIVPESRLETAQRRFDAAGAIAVTGGLALLVYAISKAPDVGWGTT